MAEAEDRIRMCLARVERCHARAVSTPHETAKKELLLIEAEWRTLAREIKDIERSRKFVADAESSMRRRYEAALFSTALSATISRGRGDEPAALVGVVQRDTQHLRFEAVRVAIDNEAVAGFGLESHILDRPHEAKAVDIEDLAPMGVHPPLRIRS